MPNWMWWLLGVLIVLAVLWFLGVRFTLHAS